MLLALAAMPAAQNSIVVAEKGVARGVWSSVEY